MNTLLAVQLFSRMSMGPDMTSDIPLEEIADAKTLL